MGGTIIYRVQKVLPKSEFALGKEATHEGRMLIIITATVAGYEQSCGGTEGQEVLAMS